MLLEEVCCQLGSTGMVGTHDSEDRQSIAQCEASKLGWCSEQWLLSFPWPWLMLLKDHHSKFLVECNLLHTMSSLRVSLYHEAIGMTFTPSSSNPSSAIFHINAILTFINDDGPPLLISSVLTLFWSHCRHTHWWQSVKMGPLGRQVERFQPATNCPYAHRSVVTPYGLPNWFCCALESVQVAISMCCCDPRLASVWMIICAVCSIVVFVQLSEYCSSNH